MKRLVRSRVLAVHRERFGDADLPASEPVDLGLEHGGGRIAPARVGVPLRHGRVVPDRLVGGQVQRGLEAGQIDDERLSRSGLDGVERLGALLDFVPERVLRFDEGPFVFRFLRRLLLGEDRGRAEEGGQQHVEDLLHSSPRQMMSGPARMPGIMTHRRRDGVESRPDRVGARANCEVRRVSPARRTGPRLAPHRRPQLPSEGDHSHASSSSARGRDRSRAGPGCADVRHRAGPTGQGRGGHYGRVVRALLLFPRSNRPARIRRQPQRHRRHLRWRVCERLRPVVLLRGRAALDAAREQAGEDPARGLPSRHSLRVRPRRPPLRLRGLRDARRPQRAGQPDHVHPVHGAQSWKTGRGRGARGQLRRYRVRDQRRPVVRLVHRPAPGAPEGPPAPALDHVAQRALHG